MASESTDRRGVQTASFPRGELQPTLTSGTLDDAFDTDLEHEVQTDKEVVKLVPCQECGRPLVVNRFYAPDIARCGSCKGTAVTSGVATVVAPVAGQTDPAKAVNLDDVLVNRTFARALCPVHPDDPEHEMELKWVGHNDHYGPSEFMGWKNGRAEYRQIDRGETVLHQCLKCKATVSYSTTVVTQMKRVNEPRDGKHGMGMVSVLGFREEVTG